MLDVRAKFTAVCQCELSDSVLWNVKEVLILVISKSTSFTKCVMLSCSAASISFCKSVT